ncbi:MAG TPA: hypothetical protein VFO34_04475 [Candidatus Acidoferrales bacterium]|nr:hypothetical protein [Candidatus Acidoferrales bacterium]
MAISLEDKKDSAALRWFFVSDHESFIQVYKEIFSGLPPKYLPILDSLCHNVSGLHLTAGLPFRMAGVAVESRRFSLNLAAERIRNRRPEFSALSDAEKESRAEEIARKNFAQYASSEAGSESLACELLSSLERFLENPDVAHAARELLRQATVLAWSTIEALANDVFIATLNEFPSLAVDLQRDERTRKRFQIRDMTDALVEFNYTLKGHMGDVLNRSQKLDDVETMRAVFDVIFPNSSRLRTELLDASLWRLYQRRNLILHRRAIVDVAYLNNTGEKLQLGSELTVDTAAFDKDLAILVHVSFSLLDAFKKSVCRTASDTEN